jgi:L-seryl-tRNA(Ser) seleniumtransferase
MLNRRSLLKSISSIPFLGHMLGGSMPVPLTGGFSVVTAKRSNFEDLGLRTFINVAGTYTAKKERHTIM